MQNNEGSGSIILGVLNLMTAMMTSNPGNGMGPDDLTKAFRGFVKTLQDVGGSAAPAGLPAPASAPAASEQKTETATTAQSQQIEAEATEIGIVAEPPLKARGKKTETAAKGKGAKSKGVEIAAISEPAPKKGKAEKSAEAAPEPVVAEEIAAEPAPVLTPAEEREQYLVARYGPAGLNINRVPIMDPEEAIKPRTITILIEGVGDRKMIHRKLMSSFGMPPQDYIDWFGLRADYPFTAPGYAKEKSVYAKKVGLGTAEFAAQAKGKATPKTSRRTRGEPKKSKTTATTAQTAAA